MQMPSPEILGLVFGGLEIGLGLFKRSTARAKSKDSGTLRSLWLVIFTSILLAIMLKNSRPWSDSLQIAHWLPYSYILGLVLFSGGLLLRWYSIFYLGRFFTVDVAIASDHSIVDTGPYTYIRHPSYTGALLTFLGFAICLGFIPSIAIVILPITLVFLYRIRVEEAALQTALGARYQEYMSRTRRLLPLIY